LQQQQTQIRNIHFDSIAVTVQFKIKFTIISSYILPNKAFTLQELQDTYNNIDTPLLITGDFYSWNKNWGSQNNNT